MVSLLSDLMLLHARLLCVFVVRLCHADWRILHMRTAHGHAVKLEREIDYLSDCLRLILDKQSLDTSPLSQTFWCIVTCYA